MDNLKICSMKCHSKGHNSHRRGASSFWMHDPELIFKELNLKCGDIFLDIGCGTGDYSINAAEKVGKTGLVYATDIQKELIDDLTRNAEEAGLENVRAIVNDVHDHLPFEDKTVDICLISTVLHSLNLEDVKGELFPEIKRVLKPKGRLIIIECKKEEMKFGPPLSLRISPDEIERHVSFFGFEKTDLVDIGYNYMIKFVSKKDDS